MVLRRWLKWPTALAVLAICCIRLADPAAAYRPFDGTDAAVADVGEVEIEFQPIGAIRGGQSWSYKVRLRRYPRALVPSAFQTPHS